MFEQIVELGPEGGVGLGGTIFALEIEDQRHQRPGDVAAAERAEMPARVGLLAQAVRPRGGLVAEGIGGHDRLADRSEAHTSVLQTLMRIFYDAFRLEKQSTTRTCHHNTYRESTRQLPTQN